MLPVGASPLAMLAPFVQWQALEGADGAANGALPVDVRRIAEHAEPVLSAAAEDAGVAGTHRAVAAFVALVAARVESQQRACFSVRLMCRSPGTGTSKSC